MHDDPGSVPHRGGSVGHDAVIAPTAIGEAVNMASRVETANRALGTRFLTTDPITSEVADHVVSRSHDPVELRGQSEPVELHEALRL